MTIRDIAAKTGYAVGTVSRALNNHPNVSDKARTAILQAAQEMGFEINVNAKQLKQTHSNTILVVTKGIGNELFGEMVETMQHLIAQTSYQMVVDYMDEDFNEVAHAARLCREKKPLGILFLGGANAHFQADFAPIDVPCVLVTNDSSELDIPNLSSVSTDDREAGYRATKALLAAGREFTALFTCADVMAIGAMRALSESGKRVPEDVSVMGVDGLPMGEYLVPQLATVAQSAGQMAKRSVEILLDCIENGASARHETVDFHIQSRESIRTIQE